MRKDLLIAITGVNKIQIFKFHNKNCTEILDRLRGLWVWNIIIRVSKDDIFKLNYANRLSLNFQTNINYIRELFKIIKQCVIFLYLKYLKTRSETRLHGVANLECQYNLRKMS